MGPDVGPAGLHARQTPALARRRGALCWVPRQRTGERQEFGSRGAQSCARVLPPAPLRGKKKRTKRAAVRTHVQDRRHVHAPCVADCARSDVSSLYAVGEKAALAFRPIFWIGRRPLSIVIDRRTPRSATPRSKRMLATHTAPWRAESAQSHADRAKTAGIRGEAQGEERAVRESERLGRIGRLTRPKSRPGRQYAQIEPRNPPQAATAAVMASTPRMLSARRKL